MPETSLDDLVLNTRVAWEILIDSKDFIRNANIDWLAFKVFINEVDAPPGVGFAIAHNPAYARKYRRGHTQWVPSKQVREEYERRKLIYSGGLHLRRRDANL